MLNNKISKIGSQEKMDECVAFAIENGIRKASEKYKISPRTVNRLKYTARKNIPFGRKVYTKRTTTEVVNTILKYVDENPLISPKDIPKMLSGDECIKKLHKSTIYEILKKNGYTRKKVTLKKKKVEEMTQRTYLNYIVPMLRKYRELKRLNKAIMVYIDETGNYSSIKKMYGYSKSGHEIVDYEVQKPVKINTFAGITDTGRIYTQDNYGNYEGDTFLRAVKELCEILPKKKIIYLFMDNASFHKKEDFKTFINEQNGKVVPIYNIPHSPEYNPIEYVFGEVKRNLRNMNITNQNFSKMLGKAFRIGKGNILNYIKHCNDALANLATSLGYR